MDIMKDQAIDLISSILIYPCISIFLLFEFLMLLYYWENSYIHIDQVTQWLFASLSLQSFTLHIIDVLFLKEFVILMQMVTPFQDYCVEDTMDLVLLKILKVIVLLRSSIYIFFFAQFNDIFILLHLLFSYMILISVHYYIMKKFR